MFEVQKQDGNIEKYSRQKLRESLLRSRVSIWLIDEIAHLVEEKFAGKKVIGTEILYRFVRQKLEKKAKKSIPRYTMKRSLLTLGPTGFPFEDFLAKVFEKKGYNTRTGQVIQGKCVPHEVDVVAWDDHELLFAEVKFHNQLKIRSDTKTALYVKARLDDLKDTVVDYPGSPKKMTRGLLITNTKFTSSSLQYGICSGVDMISFDYPPKGNLYDLIEETGLHPLTCLTELPNSYKKELLEKGVVTCKILGEDPALLDEFNLTKEKHGKIMSEIASVCDNTTDQNTK